MLAFQVELPVFLEVAVADDGAQGEDCPCAGMTLYQVLRELQIVLAVILGICPLCCQPVTLDRLGDALAGT